jgi:hypothetical protein
MQMVEVSILKNETPSIVPHLEYVNEEHCSVLGICSKGMILS